jgi:hypothetical protein
MTVAWPAGAQPLGSILPITLAGFEQTAAQLHSLTPSAL